MTAKFIENKLPILVFLLALNVYPALSVASDNSMCDWQKQIYETGLRHLKSGQNLLAASQFSPLRFSSCGNKIREAGLFGYAVAMWHLGETLELRTAIESGYSTENPVRFEILEHVALGSNIHKVSSELSTRFATWDNRYDSPEMLELQVKKPWLAGTLSALLPGAGQVYNGTYQSAALAFLLNGIFLSSAIQFSHHHMDAPAVAAGIIFSVTYVGNIISGVRGSKQLNQAAAAPYEKALQDKLFPEIELR